MTRQIFRQTSLDHLSTPEQLDQVMRVTSPAAWLTLASVFIVATGGVVWSFIGTVPVKVSGRGILLSADGVLDVISSSHGRVSRFLVRPSDWVEAGSVVAHVAQPDIENQLEVARAEAAEAESQLQRILEFQQRDRAVQTAYLKQKREVLTQELGFQEDRLKWLREREVIDRDLTAKGLIVRNRVIDTKIEINTARERTARAINEIKHLELEENTLAVAKERERIDQQMKISSLQRKVDTTRETLKRNGEVISPYSGNIVEFKVNAGEVVESGRALFSMLPQSRSGAQNGDEVKPARHHMELIAELYVRPEDGKKVIPGMTVQISPSTVKREEYGFIEGTVTSVATIPSTEEGMLRKLKNRQLVQQLSGGGAPFEVTVRLTPAPGTRSGFRWSSSAGPETEINPGTLAEGAITVRRIRLIGLFIPLFERLLERPAP
jgi:HlyD family secretion protein